MAHYWTAFDWGAYDSKTAHLSMTEDGAYRRLLSHYYRTGKPLVANATRLLGVCRARTDQEIEAVNFVLDQFFQLQDDGYHNKRADEELEKQAQLSEKRRNAGQKGGSNKAANAKQESSNCYDFATANDKQMPPQLQIQLHKDLEPASQGSKRKATRLSESFQVTDEHRTFARDNGLPSPDSEIEKFRDYWMANPKGTKLDWDATFRNWLRNAKQYGGKAIGKPDRDQQTHDDIAEVLRRRAERRNMAGATNGQDALHVSGLNLDQGSN